MSAATFAMPSLEAFSTAVEVTVAPESASIRPPSRALMPSRSAALSALSQRAPMPVVSWKPPSPICTPMTSPSAFRPSTTVTSPP